MASDVKATYLTASGSVFAGRARIKAIHYQAGSSPTLALKNGGSGGTTLLTLTFVNTTDDSIYIPDEGMLFDEGCYAVLTNVTSVTVFYN
jgi:hypothetical protein|tara:strand:+ start:1756 stop:2025 length:270 start_codon:yes stop_codon:yes gene_type:complete